MDTDRQSETNLLSIVIPVKEQVDVITEFILRNKPYLESYNVIIIDSGGGESLKTYSFEYIYKNVPLWEARRIGYDLAKTEYILNLDSDVIIPENYIEKALVKFKEIPKLACISIFFEDVSKNAGVLEYGVSIWKTDIVRKLYDYNPRQRNQTIVQVSERTFTMTEYPYCECSYMWKRAVKAGYKIETLNMRAKHINRTDKND